MEYEQNTTITDDFFIQNIVEKKKLIELTLRKEDDPVTIKAILKDNIDLFVRTYKADDHIVCKARTRKFYNQPVLEVVYIKKYEFEKTDKELVIDIDAYIKRFDTIITKVTDKDYSSLLDVFFGNEDTREMFFVAPAARANHHNYEGGLLHHTVEVAEMVIFMGEYYKPVNMDLLITGAILHDVGKVKSYDFGHNGIIRTDWDHLLGHLSISSIFVSKMLPENFDSNKAMLLYHLLLSHHKNLEWGSPVETRMKEAELLHYADMMSFSMGHIEHLEYTGNWSKFDELTKRQWFKTW